MPSERWTPEISARWERYPKMMDTSVQVEMLGKHLNKQKKAALIKMLVDSAKHDRKLLRMLQLAFPQHFPLHLLAIFVRQAIDDATRFDERRRSYNFSYDHVAYEGVAWGLAELIRRADETLSQEGSELIEQILDLNYRPFAFSLNLAEVDPLPPAKQVAGNGLELAMELALILVRDGSKQMAASDEGIMLEEIETCLQPVVTAANEQLSSNEFLPKWLAMLEQSDQCGVIDFQKLITNRNDLNGSESLTGFG